MRLTDYYYDSIKIAGGEIIFTRGQAHGYVGINESYSELRDKLIERYGYYLNTPYKEMKCEYCELVNLIKSRPIICENRVRVCNVVDFVKKTPILTGMGDITIVFGNSEMLKEVRVPEATIYRSGNRFFAITNADDDCCHVSEATCKTDTKEMEQDDVYMRMLNSML